MLKRIKYWFKNFFKKEEVYYVELPNPLHPSNWDKLDRMNNKEK